MIYRDELFYMGENIGERTPKRLKAALLVADTFLPYLPIVLNMTEYDDFAINYDHYR